ncbi:MAG: AmmeMemoRadiSam system protein A [Gemmatimonadetes bacterium]|nr:AmmeMemoRadiSam system protein A [Gemmatimonadota bacterium]NNM03611.1 AmmeMemoRadiSam system protein A [Gemmatimonadota bacterium]
MTSRDLGSISEEDRSGRLGGIALSKEERDALRGIALASIRSGLAHHRPQEPAMSEVSSRLREPGATFVTLNLRGQLRGCVGSLEARRPLAEDVAKNAYSAAFGDPRFPPLSWEELADLEVHISLLSPLEPLLVRNRRALLELLRPDVDGLVMEDPPHRATFLPQVWGSLPEPENFLGELFLKAGLGRDHWSETVSFSRYSVYEF